MPTPSDDATLDEVLAWYVPLHARATPLVSDEDEATFHRHMSRLGLRAGDYDQGWLGLILPAAQRMGIRHRLAHVLDPDLGPQPPPELRDLPPPVPRLSDFLVQLRPLHVDAPLARQIMIEAADASGRTFGAIRELVEEDKWRHAARSAISGFPEALRDQIIQALLHGNPEPTASRLAQEHRMSAKLILRAFSRAQAERKHMESIGGRPLMCVTKPRAEVFDTLNATLPNLHTLFRQGSAEAGYRIVSTSEISETDREALAKHGVRIDTGTPVLFTCKPSAIADRIDRVCKVYGMTDNGPQPTDFPVERIREWMDTNHPQTLYPIRGVRPTPLMRADGSIAADPGYDPMSEFYIAEHGLTLKVPAEPTQAEAAAAALKFVCPDKGLFRTFPFDLMENGAGGDDGGATNRAGALALTMTLAGRTLFGRLVPGFAADAPQARTGKMMMLATASIVALGKRPAAISLGDKAEERAKRLSHALVMGSEFRVFDNLNGDSGAFLSDDLNTLMGEGCASIRMYGSTKPSEWIDYDFTIGWTGNNIKLSGDLETRNLRIRLDARVGNPAARHFTFDPHKEATERRAEFLSAVFTVLRWSIQNPMPEAQARQLAACGVFDAWRRIVRDGLWQLLHVDVGQLFNAARTADPERESVHASLTALREVFGTGDFSVSDVWEIVRQRTEADSQADAADHVDVATRDHQRRVLEVFQARTAQRIGLKLSKCAGKWTADDKLCLWRRVRDGVTVYGVRSREEEDFRRAEAAARRAGGKPHINGLQLDGEPTDG